MEGHWKVTPARPSWEGHAPCHPPRLGLQRAEGRSRMHSGWGEGARGAARRSGWAVGHGRRGWRGRRRPAQRPWPGLVPGLLGPCRGLWTRRSPPYTCARQG